MHLHTKTIGAKDHPVILWAHGWGQSHAAFIPLAESLQGLGKHILIDLPGFGQSPKPDEDWGTEDYADFIAGWIRDQGLENVIWTGHSFGCRVGIRLAAKYPELVKGMVVIAGHGLSKTWKKPGAKSYFRLKVWLFKFLKKLIPLGLVDEEWLKSKFGSPDYRAAGPMRNILVKTVNEDLSALAEKVTCPVQLIYGEKDEHTPPEFGARYAAAMPNAKLSVLPNQDHYSLLGAGRHPVAALVQEFMASLSHRERVDET